MTDFGALGFYRVAAVHTRVRPGDPRANAEAIRAAAETAAERGACVVLFPELSITGYSCEDLFQGQGFLLEVRKALAALAAETKGLAAALVVGAPFQAPDGRLYNAAFVLHRGRIRGAVPKSHLPNYGEFYERRWWIPGAAADDRIADDLLGTFRLSTRQLFQIGRMVFAVEVCEDLWAPEPPSGAHAVAGANVILNLSASNELVAKADYRRDLVRMQSARLDAAYVYVSCGPSESTKDVVFGGHAMIAEAGTMLAEGGRFDLGGASIAADVDVDRLMHDRARDTTFGNSPRAPGYAVERLEGAPPPLASLDRAFSRTPFVPDAPGAVDERAREILSIQATGLARRLEASASATAVIGVSGGLDSTLALLVAVEAMRKISRPATAILAVSMPGMGTTERTRKSAADLSARVGATFREIPIVAAVEQHFKDIGHDPKAHDVVYENSQARERTQVLFDLANKHKGIVVGTGDLSELALGWCTYNADHMANYAVNVSVPKTLVKHLVRWYAGNVADAATRAVLEAILSTTISPELLPPGADGEIVQETEKVVGPYVLHDFFLFHHQRHGAGPARVFALACRSFAGEFGPAEVKRWLRLFFERFYRQQFKRTTLPPGPKVGSVSLSPRGDLRLPDEVDPSPFLKQIDAL
ncbi:MAG TPA: NAD(+) synthase [Planctomycetota bacterium]|nr:NAD(+) synthase [Planctomycetota bacterium]